MFNLESFNVGDVREVLDSINRSISIVFDCVHIGKLAHCVSVKQSSKENWPMLCKIVGNYATVHNITG